MLKAKLDSVRKNKKGFSLVELIIVIAIMVALIAVMAPAFVKYVQKSRDAALATAAEDYEKAIQTYVGDPDTDTTAILTSGTSGTIKLSVAGGLLKIEPTNITATAQQDINDLAGADTTKKMGATEKAYTITITISGSDVKVSMKDS